MLEQGVFEMKVYSKFNANKEGSIHEKHFSEEDLIKIFRYSKSVRRTGTTNYDFHYIVNRIRDYSTNEMINL